MKIFIINLKESTERRHRMEQQLGALKLAHEFIDAVDGRKLSDSEKNVATQPINYAYLDGEIGCALSHQKIYQTMLEESIDSALILEDDVSINTQLCEVIEKINLSASHPEVVLLSRVNKHYLKPIKQISDEFFLHKTHYATTAHSYIINLPAAKNLAKNLYPVWMVADKWSLFEDLSYVNVFSVIPHPVSLSDESTTSTINENKQDDALCQKKKAIWQTLMKRRPFIAKLKHRYRRAIAPLFHRIINQGKG